MSEHVQPLSEKFQSAMDYAFQLHKDQIRKGSNVPYISHLMAVTGLVLESDGDEDEAIAAVLHDAVEDQGGLATLEDIRRRFGEKVASIVKDCSDSFSTPKPPWRERKEKYLQKLETASPSVLKISLADKFHNIRSLYWAYLQQGEKTWDKFRGGKVGTLWYYHELSKAFHKHKANILLLEFDRYLELLDKEIGKYNKGEF
jgi:(p)ppGpp synthase/HD superfamily hydrolase